MQQTIGERLVRNVIENNRYTYLVNGLGVTLEITIFALIIGVMLGLIAAAGMLYEGKSWKLRAAKWISTIYVDIIRGTPLVVQLLIASFFVLSSPKISPVMVAIITFGINSGAYVAEIARAGIQGVDKGQIEAGRSLGLGSLTVMKEIVLPQAIKNILPALCNELIALVKETSIVGYIAINDLTRGGAIIRSQTLDPITLFLVAIIYLIITTSIARLMTLLERRLKKGDTG